MKIKWKIWVHQVHPEMVTTTVSESRVYRTSVKEDVVLWKPEKNHDSNCSLQDANTICVRSVPPNTQNMDLCDSNRYEKVWYNTWWHMHCDWGEPHTSNPDIWNYYEVPHVSENKQCPHKPLINEVGNRVRLKYSNWNQIDGENEGSLPVLYEPKCVPNGI